MPTGYTHKVCEGTITDFPEFAMSCARAFGALITMRDDPMDAAIPNEFAPDTKYYDERLADSKKRLQEVMELSKDDLETVALAEHAEALAHRKTYLANKELEASRLNDMIAKVRMWHPPTPDHVEMKKFMIEQIEMSFPGTYAPSIPALLDGTAWRQKEINRLSDDVVRYQKEVNKEIERARGRSEWVKALRASLSSDLVSG